jgi:hypothetical protein
VQFAAEIAIVNDTAYNAPDGDVNAATIDWHDGTTSNGTVVSLGGGQYEIDGSHEYNATGTYSPTVTAHDVGGAVGSDAATVNAAKVTLTTDATNNTITVSKTGNPVVVTVSCSDPGLGLNISPASGSNYATTQQHPDPSTWTLTFESHTGGTGQVTITLKARAQDGTLLDDSAISLTINVVP